AALLWTAIAWPEQDRPTKLESTSGSPGRRGGDRYAAQDEASPQNSPETEKKKGRSLFRSWFHMATETQANQPDWLSPLATTSGRLKQERRYDICVQPATLGNRACQLVGGRGCAGITRPRARTLGGLTSALHSASWRRDWGSDECACGRHFGSLQQQACKLRSRDSIPTTTGGCSRREFPSKRQESNLRYTPVAHMIPRRRVFQLRLPSRILELGQRTLVMGVLNVTPDSFSDGGRFSEPESAIEHAFAIERAGADLLDIGGESTR